MKLLLLGKFMWASTDKHWILAKIPSNLIKFCVLAQIATFSSSKVERLRFLKLNFNEIVIVKLWRENLFQHVIWHAEQVCFYDKGPKNASKGLKSTFFDENCQFRPFRALIRPRVINPKLLSASNYISKLFFPPKFYHENFVKIQCFQMRLGWNKKELTKEYRHFGGKIQFLIQLFVKNNFGFMHWGLKMPTSGSKKLASKSKLFLSTVEV